MNPSPPFQEPLGVFMIKKFLTYESNSVTASEGVDREVTGDDDELGGGLWRPLSYNPLAATDCPESLEEIVEPFPHIPAYKVSAEKRLAQVIFGAVMCCLASGIVFGFASLKPILIAEGVYSELCEANISDGNALDDTIPCPEQDMRLNLFFVAASTTANITALFAGYWLDHFGRRSCYVIASIFIAAGSVLLGYAFAIPEFDGYTLGNIMLSIGGTFLFVPSFRLANAFPKYSGLIVAIITGSFDASAAVLLLYQVAWEATNRTFEPNQFFFAYTIVPVILLIGEFTLMPRDAYQTTPDLEYKIEKACDATRDIHDSDQDVDPTELYHVRTNRADRRLLKLSQIEDVLGDADEREERAHKNEEIQQASGVWGVLHGLPAHRQMMTAWFIFILLLTILQMLKMNLFISTITSQYRYLLQSDKEAEAISKFFGIALPLGGIATTPFIGLLLNSFSVTTIIGILTGFIAVIGILNCLPFVWAGYTTVVLFVIFRPLYYSAMSDYATKVFGFTTFGRLYGAITCISGILTFSQSGIDVLVHGPLDGNPTPVNIVMTIAGTGVGLFLTIYIWVKSKGYQEVIKDDCHEQQEQMRLIRGGREGYGAIL
ncbi:amino acid transporter [Xylaria cubensis]|nr:amino acid transporter [Xylaria cubensis]